jgi:hypothetical protein
VELQNVYFLPNQNGKIKWRGIGGAEHVTRTKSPRDMYKILVGNLQDKRLLWGTRRRWKYHRKISLRSTSTKMCISLSKLKIWSSGWVFMNTAVIILFWKSKEFFDTSCSSNIVYRGAGYANGTKCRTYCLFISSIVFLYLFSFLSRFFLNYKNRLKNESRNIATR